MLRFCLAFSMSLLTSGVMLNRSFLGMGRGTMGDRTSSGFFLQGHGGPQAHASARSGVVWVHPWDWGGADGSLKLKGTSPGRLLGLLF